MNDLLDNIYSKVNRTGTVSLDGIGPISISDVLRISTRNVRVKLEFGKKHTARLIKVHEEMIKQVKAGDSIYGVTASYGGRSDLIVNTGNSEKRLEKARKLSYAITHVDVSTGEPVAKEIVRAAVFIRLCMLSKGFSAVRIKVLEALADLLNNDITPIVGRYGSLGASGDLAQNGRILSCLLFDKNVKAWNKNNKVRNAMALMKEKKLTPLKLEPKEGLALVNGDNFSSAASVLLLDELVKLFVINLGVCSIAIQALNGSSRNFHPLLHKIRPHKGQRIISEAINNLLSGSKLIKNEITGHRNRTDGEKVQDPYSIRCIPQYYGPDVENLIKCHETILVNINSVSDNPVWTDPDNVVDGEAPYKWVSGGNFLASYVADVIDTFRITMTRIIKHNDRLMARLVHPQFNNGLPANLSDKSSISQTLFKGLQTQMGMYEVYATMLSEPVGTKFGYHEEFNQDITSHSFTSAIFSWELVKILKYSIATTLIASCQATDLLGGPSMISSSTRNLYEWTRKRVPYVKKEEPMGKYVEDVGDSLLKSDLFERFKVNVVS